MSSLRTSYPYSSHRTYSLGYIPYAIESNPHNLLGPHKEANGKVSISSYLPGAQKAQVKRGDVFLEMQRFSRSLAIFQAETNFCNPEELGEYEIVYSDSNGNTNKIHDPYRFTPAITSDDEWLWGKGEHHQIYKTLGAQVISDEKKYGVKGVHFGVWAPNAESVSVVGDFNNWIPGAHLMSKSPHQGLWGLFIPELKEGEKYKFAVRKYNSTAYHYLYQLKNDPGIAWKADPFAHHAEFRPGTASIISDIDNYNWGDSEWMQKPRSVNNPMSTLEIHPGSWKRKDGNQYLSYVELAHDVVSYAKKQGYTHIQLMGTMEHPYDPSWGYQVTGYFAPTSRFGNPKDFMYFVDHCHKNNIGVNLDWVPGHFPKDNHGLEMFDGTPQYEYADPKIGMHFNWGTKVFDYSKPQVRNFLTSSALFWLDYYHIDGLRVDGVASMLWRNYDRQEWLPDPRDGGNIHWAAIDAIKQINSTVHDYHQGTFMIAEQSSVRKGDTDPSYLDSELKQTSLDFDSKWNMGWMHDTLRFFRRPYEGTNARFQNIKDLIHTTTYAYDDNFVLSLSHDEVVHLKKSLLEKMPGNEKGKFANLRILLSYMFTFPGKKLLFMGSDFAQRKEWNDSQSLDWHLTEQDPESNLHLGISRLVSDLNKLYTTEKPLHELDYDPEGFQWIDFDSNNDVLSYIRWSKDRKDFILCVMSFSTYTRETYDLSVPVEGEYVEIFNSHNPTYSLENNPDTEASATSHKGTLHPKENGEILSANSKSGSIDWIQKNERISLKIPPISLKMYKLKDPQKATALMQQETEREISQQEIEAVRKRSWRLKRKV